MNKKNDDPPDEPPRVPSRPPKRPVPPELRTRPIPQDILLRITSLPEADDPEFVEHYIKHGKILLFGGPGDLPETAVVIHASNSGEGVAAERAYAAAYFQCKDDELCKIQQRLVTSPPPACDHVVYLLPDGTQRGLWFDISSFFPPRAPAG